MKKIFTLFTAIALTTAASADTVWDFTVLPTQTIDGTGNLGTNATDGVFVEDDGAAWAIAYNLSGIEDGTEFTSKAGEVFEPTKGLVWSALPNEKMVIYRNYPTNYGGKYLFMNKACEVMIPAKAGQVIEIVAGTAKNNKKITSQDVVETFTTDDGETLNGVVVDGAVNYDYKPYTLTVKVDNPYISFENNICIQRITVKEASAASPTKWDFTILPTQTIDGTGNLGTNATDGVFVEDDGAAWAIAYNLSGIEDGTEFTSKAGEVFEPTKGLVWSALPNEKMVIYRNYPTNYGGKYLFMNKACEVMIPAKAGQVIEIVAGTAKNNKKITSQDVVETFTTDDGETLNGVVVDGAVNYDYKPYTLTVKVDNPYISFENNICIQTIELKDATAITSVTADKVKDYKMYNIAGQRISTPIRGQIYIMNGKKYIAQ